MLVRHACGLTETTVRRLIKEGKLPPVRRMLMGLGDEAHGMAAVRPSTHHM